MNPKHQDKVHELVDTLCSTLKIEAERLYRSGGVDVDSYNGDDYVLAKILVTAAIKQHENDFRPFDGEDRKIVENLLCF